MLWTIYAFLAQAAYFFIFFYFSLVLLFLATFFFFSVPFLSCEMKWKHPLRFHVISKRVHVHVHVRTARALWMSCGHFFCFVGTCAHRQTMILCVSLVNVLFHVLHTPSMPCTHYFHCAENVQCRWNDSALLFSNFSVRLPWCSMNWPSNHWNRHKIGCNSLHFFFSSHLFSFSRNTPYSHDLCVCICVFHFENRVVFEPNNIDQSINFAVNFPIYSSV